MRKLIVTLALVFGAMPSLQADPFEGSELILGRSVKPPKGTKTVTVGLRFAVSPLDFALGKARDQLIEKAAKEACHDDVGCISGVKSAFEQMEKLPDAEWDRLERAATSGQALDQELQRLVDSGLISQQDKINIERAVNTKSDPQERKEVLGLARKVSEAKSNILLEPYLDLNFELVEVTAALPLVLAVFENSTDVGLGNFNGAVTFGHHLSLGVATFGLSYGLHLFLPTGGDASAMAARSFLYEAPRYLNQYLSFSPFLVVGADLPFVTVQASGAFVSMHKVRGYARYSSVQYFQYGLGVTFFPRFFLSGIGELNGLVPLHDASSFDALYGLFGLQLRLLFVKAQVAAQLPIRYKKDSSNLPSIRGIDVDKLAKFTIVARAGFEF